MRSRNGCRFGGNLVCVGFGDRFTVTLTWSGGSRIPSGPYYRDVIKWCGGNANIPYLP